MREKSWIVYDHRANFDVDDATVLVSCSSLPEARKYLKDFREYDPVIFEYNVAADNKLVNGVIVK